jgi:hypothetical protein
MMSAFFGFSGLNALDGVPWWAVMIPVVIVLWLAWFMGRDKD